MKILSKYIYLLFVVLVGFTGCINDAVDGPEIQRDDDAVEFDLEFISRADPSNPNSPLYDYFIDGRSIILISQRANNLSLDFNDYDPSPTDPSELIPNTNLYKYVYYTNPSAVWDSGFNFQPYGDHALDWAQIEAAGELSGGYTLGALYYPVEYEVQNAVPEDQSIYNNLLSANVLGAYHTTNAVKSRLRFRFFHLMAAVRVTLLIPEWDPVTNTGFGADAAKSAFMLKVRSDYTIDWPNTLSSEEYPTPSIPTDAPETEIKMYLESVSNEVYEVDLSEYGSDYPETEKVRSATFVVVFPPQQPTNDGPTMRFFLTTMGGTEKRFIWYSSSIDKGTLEFNARNTITNLTLFLPRVDNDAILISSYIVPWTEAESEFTVLPDDRN